MRPGRGRTRAAVVATVVGLLLSGCSSSDDADAAGQPSPGEAGGVAAQAAALDGLVVDEEERPLSRVLVGILELDAWAPVGEDGRFTLTGLPRGDHNVTALAPGFEQAYHKVTVRPGRDSEPIVFRLVREPTIEPYRETITWVGSLDYPSTSGAENGNFIFRIPNEGLRRLLYEATWQPQPSGRNLQWNLRDEVQSCNCGPERYTYWAGPPDLQFDMIPGNYHEGGDLPFNGAKGTGYRANWRHLPYDLTNPNFFENVSFVLNLRIDNYITFFYWDTGEPGFTALPEA